MSGPTRPPDPSELLTTETGEVRQLLTEEFAAGYVHLPGFPDAVLHVQRVLNDDRVDVEQIVQAVNLEPQLATQVLRIANSATFNSAARQIRDMPMAVQRIGNPMVRAAALAFGMQQLRNSEEMRRLRDRISAQWRRGVVVGAISKALSTQMRMASPDTALFAGLAHVVGRLYVLTRLNRTPWLLDQPGLAERLMDQLGGYAGSALLENWLMPAEITSAITNYSNPDRDLTGPVGLTDLLAGGTVLADLLPPSRTDYLDQIQLANVYLQTEPLWKRMGRTRENCSDALHRALEDVQQLRAMFGA
ncbi:MAG: HDOD domain-containing protein [Steroidobacteraceae bacterium]